MDPYVIRTKSHNVIIKRIVWLRNVTHQLVALTRPDVTIQESDKTVIRKTVKVYSDIRNNKNSTLQTNYEFYQDAALNMFLIAAERFLNLHDLAQRQLPPSCDDIIALYDAIWTDYWLRYDQDISNKEILRNLYNKACCLGSYVVVDPFKSSSKFNPYVCKCCILCSAYTGIGRFENLCNPNETDYREMFTKCLNINPDTGLCSHICIEESASGQRYEKAILNAHRVNR